MHALVSKQVCSKHKMIFYICGVSVSESFLFHDAFNFVLLWLSHKQRKGIQRSEIPLFACRNHACLQPTNE